MVCAKDINALLLIMENSPCLIFFTYVIQDLNKEAARFKKELWMGIRDINTKTDLIILVHNLSHKIPWYTLQSNTSTRQPSLSFLLDEAKALGIPWVLAITNKFSVSAHQQKPAVEAVLDAYQANPTTTEVINSCPYVMPSPATEEIIDPDVKLGPHKLIAGPINLVRRSFQKRSMILPVEGVSALCQLVHRVLRNHEEVALEVTFGISYFYDLFIKFLLENSDSVIEIWFLFLEGTCKREAYGGIIERERIGS